MQKEIDIKDALSIVASQLEGRIILEGKETPAGILAKLLQYAEYSETESSERRQQQQQQQPLSPVANHSSLTMEEINKLPLLEALQHLTPLTHEEEQALQKRYGKLNERSRQVWTLINRGVCKVHYVKPVTPTKEEKQEQMEGQKNIKEFIKQNPEVKVYNVPPGFSSGVYNHFGKESSAFEPMKAASVYASHNPVIPVVFCNKAGKRMCLQQCQLDTGADTPCGPLIQVYEKIIEFADHTTIAFLASEDPTMVTTYKSEEAEDKEEANELSGIEELHFDAQVELPNMQKCRVTLIGARRLQHLKSLGFWLLGRQAFSTSSFLWVGPSVASVKVGTQEFAPGVHWAEPEDLQPGTLTEHYFPDLSEKTLKNFLFLPPV